MTMIPIRTLWRKIRKRLAKKAFIENLDGGRRDLSLRALLYYKNEPYWDPVAVSESAHTNLWEIIELQHILNRLGFVVDAIDRDCDGVDVSNKYDLFLGLGAGNSGRHFVRLAEQTSSAVKIMLAMGPAPDLSNSLVEERYAAFRQRTGVAAPSMRTVTKVTGDRFLAIADLADYIFAIGEPQSFSPQTYLEYGKPVLTFMPGVSSGVGFQPRWLRTRKRNTFLCFAGNGFICKGVDLLVEAFEQMPDMQLVICGPDSEPAFFETYGQRIAASANISYRGFISVGSKDFAQLCAECSYTILHSSSEGCATSVATCQCAGLPPLVSHATSIDVRDFGWILPDEDNIRGIVDTVRMAASVSVTEYRRRAMRTLDDAQRYSRSNYTATMTSNIIQVLSENLDRFGA